MATGFSEHAMRANFLLKQVLDECNGVDVQVTSLSKKLQKSKSDDVASKILKMQACLAPFAGSLRSLPRLVASLPSFPPSLTLSPFLQL